VFATFRQREPTIETPVSAEPAPSEDGAPAPAPTLPSEATQSGEEDEVCIHKVRAKLFRLETRPKVVAESIPNKDDDDDDEGESAPATAATAAAPAAAPTTEPEPEPAAGAPAGAAAAVEASGSGAEVGEGVGDDLMETRWLERGVGQVKLLMPKGGGGEDSTARLVMRVENVGRLILNAPLLASTTLVERPTDNTLRLVLYSSESTSASCAKPGHFVLRVKIPAEAEALQAAINKCVSNLQK